MFEDDTQEVTEEEVIEVEEDETEEEEDTTDWKAVAQEKDAQLKKAEQAIIKAKTKPKTESTSNGLSTVDIIALTRANIADEDIDEVLDYAKYKNVSVAEALKSSVVKATISERAEERKSAQAVHTGGGTRRAGNAVSDERLLADAAKGIMPDSEADIAKLARLKFQRK